jgi:hypothetical protein
LEPGLSALSGPLLVVAEVVAGAVADAVFDVPGDDVRVRADSQVFDPLPWPAKSVLFSPTQRPGAPADSLLPLMAPAVRTYIHDFHVALNGPPPEHANGTEVQTPVHLPAGLKIPPTPACIVGLYEGGCQYDFDVFHPAGLCWMRSSSNEGVIRFCYVCQYLLVDKIDPTKHFKLDALYGPDYPEP